MSYPSGQFPSDEPPNSGHRDPHLDEPNTVQPLQPSQSPDSASATPSNYNYLRHKDLPSEARSTSWTLLESNAPAAPTPPAYHSGHQNFTDENTLPTAALSQSFYPQRAQESTAPQYVNTPTTPHVPYNYLPDPNAKSGLAATSLVVAVAGFAGVLIPGYNFLFGGFLGAIAAIIALICAAISLIVGWGGKKMAIAALCFAGVTLLILLFAWVIFSAF